MFVKQVSVSQKTDKLPVGDFNIDAFALKNYRGDIVFETTQLDADNSSIKLEKQAFAGSAEVRGDMTVPSGNDLGILQIVVGQNKGATWDMLILSTPESEDLECIFGLPPTTLNLLGGRLPIPTQSVCEASSDVPVDEIDL